MKRVVFNFIYLNDVEYNQKDVLKLLSGRDVISYFNITDRSSVDINLNKNLIACLILKKLKKILSKKKDFIEIFYFVNNYEKDTLLNVKKHVDIYSNDISYNIYTNNSEQNNFEFIESFYNIEKLYSLYGERV